MAVFPKVSKSEWLAKIERDLKGKPLSTLDWKSAGLQLDPIYTQKDTDQTNPLPSHVQSSWQIGARIIVRKEKIEQANAEALALLNKGANALCFVLPSGFDFSQLAPLLKDIQLEWIATHIEAEVKDHPKYIAAIHDIIAANEYTFNKIDLGISNAAADDISTFIANFPTGRCIALRSESNTDDEVSSALGNLLNQGNAMLKVLRQAEQAPSLWNRNIIFQLTMSDHYFLNIAKVRALKLLWAKVLGSWDADLTAVPFIEAHVSPKGAEIDKNYNKIRASSQALSAAVAGVDRMYIYPSDVENNESGSVFTNRIALNINHLLLQESHIGTVQDPSAGSYFIEQLTDDLCAAAWANFQTRQQEQ